MKSGLIPRTVAHPTSSSSSHKPYRRTSSSLASRISGEPLQLPPSSVLVLIEQPHNKGLWRELLLETGDRKSSILSGDFLPSLFSDEQQDLGRFLPAAPSVPASTTFTASFHSLFARRQPIFRPPPSYFPVSLLAARCLSEVKVIRNRTAAIFSFLSWL